MCCEASEGSRKATAEAYHPGIKFLCSQAAAQCYIELIVKESDNNVKLIVVGRLALLRERGGDAARRALPDIAMDVLRVLASSDLDVRKHTLDLGKHLARHFVKHFANNKNQAIIGLLFLSSIGLGDEPSCRRVGRRFT